MAVVRVAEEVKTGNMTSPVHVAAWLTVLSTCVMKIVCHLNVSAIKPSFHYFLKVEMSYRGTVGVGGLCDIKTYRIAVQRIDTSCHGAAADL